MILRQSLRRKPSPSEPTLPEPPPAFEDDPRAVAPDYGKAPAKPVTRTVGGVARYG